MVASVFASNILREAKSAVGNVLLEAMRQSLPVPFGALVTDWRSEESLPFRLLLKSLRF